MRARYPKSFPLLFTPPFQAVSSLPIVWFYEDYEDSKGVWLHLLFILRVNGLKMTGVRTTPCHMCSLDHVVEMSSSLGGGGLAFPSVPSFPMSFSQLLDRMCELSLITYG